MTTTPGDGQEPTEPYREAPVEPGSPWSGPPEPPPGYWQQQAQSPGYGPPGQYGDQPPQYGQPPPYGQQGYQPPPDHPKATTAMVLGILGLVLCGVLAPFAWVIGKRTMNEIDASGGRLGGRGQAQAGYVLGLIGSLLIGLALLLVVVVVLFAVLGSLSSTS